MHRVRRLRGAVLACAFVVALAGAANAQAPAEPAAPPAAAAPAADHVQPAIDAQPADTHAAEGEHAAEAEHHGFNLADLFWPVLNFAIMIGVLYYFFSEPMAGYLRDRSSAIRKDLVEASSMKAAATAQLAEIDRKMQALPGEIEALRTRGQAEIAAEEQRIAQQAAAERDRLVDQAKRQIDVQVRLAKRELTEHAADLAVDLAADRIKSETTPADHERLVSRYLQQVKG